MKPTAIYLIRQGTYTNPRPVELQLANIRRYKWCLAEQKGFSFSTDKIYVDLDADSSVAHDMQSIPAYESLLDDVERGEIETVLVDIWRDIPFHADFYRPLFRTLRDAGAKVLNAAADDEGALQAAIDAQYGKGFSHYAFHEDAESIITLYPALASRIAAKLIRSTNFGHCRVRTWDDIDRHLAAYAEKRAPGRAIPLLNDADADRMYEQRRIQEEKRRRTEDLWQASPDDAGHLFDEGFLSVAVRPKDAFPFAYERLSALGFTLIRKGRLLSYQRREGEFVIYADPRPRSRIQFLIFRQPPEDARRPTETEGSTRPIGTFYLLDSWVKDLPNRWQSRFLQAVGVVHH